jgi:hypothetical protein
VENVHQKHAELTRLTDRPYPLPTSPATISGGRALDQPTLTTRILVFMGRNWGNLASVAGLIVAAISAYFAQRASAAAKEAKQAVLSSTFAEEINLAQKLAAEVGNLIDLGKHELARLRCNDLHDRTVVILKRWEVRLPIDSKNNLLAAKAQLESLRAVTSKLSATATAPSARQVSQMQGSCGTIRDIFIEEHASAMRRNDEADNE